MFALSPYGSQTSPLSIQDHSTRDVASPQALFKGTPLNDICVEAGRDSPHTFIKFYRILSVIQQSIHIHVSGYVSVQALIQ